MNQQIVKQKPTPDANRKTLHLFIAGTGAVGGRLIEQLSTLPLPYNLKVVGCCNTQNYTFRNNGAASNNILNELPSGQQTNWSHILSKFRLFKGKHILFVDATGSEQVAKLYPQLMDEGLHIVTPSKLANTFEQSYYNILKHKAEENNVQFRYETTVGAGLPIISTIKDLLQSGDEITKISGVVSGTMTYLFNELEKGTSFSEAIKKARELGYAEPDPRDDLSGEDVARKFLTIARELGIATERSQLNVESLIPEELTSVNRKTFFDRLQEADQYWKQKVARAKKTGDALRYSGTLINGKIIIGVQAVPLDSPLGNLRGTDNLLQIYSRRYNETPMIIQGPGAGKDVTAAGVLSDILKIATSIF